jgi:hypothetical protein
MFEHFVAWQGERDAQAAAAMPDGTDKNATVDRAHRLNTWSHEDMSIQLLDLLIESNDIPLEMYFSTEPGVRAIHMHFFSHWARYKAADVTASLAAVRLGSGASASALLPLPGHCVTAALFILLRVQASKCTHTCLSYSRFLCAGNPTPAEHLELVKQLIRGLKPSEPWPRGTGRGEEKRFLYDIVSNSRHGLDVDKLDYLLRDSMACLGETGSERMVREWLGDVLRQKGAGDHGF